MKQVLLLAWQRIRFLVLTTSIEWGEGISILSALAWFIPLCVQPDYLSTSLYLRGVEAHVARPAAIGIATSLLFLQSLAVVLGGQPSLFIRRTRDVIVWYWVRFALQLWAFFVWWSLSLLLTTARFGVGTILWAGIGCICGYSAYRLTLGMRVEMKLAGLREKRRFAKSHEGYELALAAAAQAGPRSLLKPVVPPAAVPRVSERGRDA